MVVMRPRPLSGVNEDDVRNSGLFTNTIDHSKQKLTNRTFDYARLPKLGQSSIEIDWKHL